MSVLWARRTRFGVGAGSPENQDGTNPDSGVSEAADTIEGQIRAAEKRPSENPHHCFGLSAATSPSGSARPEQLEHRTARFWCTHDYQTPWSRFTTGDRAGPSRRVRFSAKASSPPWHPH
jgi:hypothetical protein